MSKCKKNYYVILFSMIFILCIASSSSAVMRGNITDEVDFSLGQTAIFIEGTHDGDTEIATVPFTVNFHQETIPTGKISKLYVEFEYNTTNLTLVGAYPDESWGELEVNTDYWGGDAGETGTVQFTIYPEAGASLDVTSGTMTLVYFEFKAKCQVQENLNYLTFANPDSYIDIDLNDGTHNSYIPDLAYTTNGYVLTEYYMADIRVLDQVYRGVVGQSISIPINGWSNAMIDGISFSLEYDSGKLQYAGIENYETYFPEGFNDDPLYTEPAVGDNPIHFDLITGDAAMADIQGSVYDQVLVNVIFNVIGEWDGESTPIDFTANPTTPDFLIRIAQDVDGYCEDVSLSMLIRQGSINLVNGNISIPAYAADIETRLVDSEHRIWNTGVANQDVQMTVRLGNNFNAGPRLPETFGSITAVVEQPDILTRPIDDEDFITQNTDISPIFSWDYSGTSPDIYAIHQLYQEPLESNVVPISEYGVEGEGGVDLVYLNYKFDDTIVTGFMDNSYTLDIHPIVEFPFYDHFTEIEVADYDKKVSTTDGLTMIPSEFRIATGEFFCDNPTSSTWDVTQKYYTRNSFDLKSFSVKVVVSGYHYIQEVRPENGVIPLIAPNGRSVTFTTNSNWTGGEFLAYTKFAEIDYSNTAPPIAAKAGPGPGGDCHYHYYYSTIAFEDEFMSNLADDDPLNPEGNQPYLFTKANKISKRELRCPIPPDSDPLPGDYKSAHAVIPEEFMLYQNYPNPFNPDTKFAFDLPEASYVRIEIFNILGQHVKTLVNETKSAGSYEIHWNATDENGQKVSSGIYLYIMQAGDYSRSAKMTLMK